MPVPPPSTIQKYDTSKTTLVTCVDLIVSKKSQNYQVESQWFKNYPYYRVLSEYQRFFGMEKTGWAELKVKVPRKGRYNLRMTAHATPESGIAKVSVNGKIAAANVDLYSPEITPLPVLDLGEHDLKAGLSDLRIETIGKNPKSKAYHFGITNLILRRVAGMKAKG